LPPPTSAGAPAGRTDLAETLAREGLAVFVSDADARIVATCMLISAPNLLRGGQQHGIIENVVTHPGFQGRGHGRAVIAAALDEAWKRDCYQVLLQSGRADPRVHRFYEGCGFVPGLRTAYCARRPADKECGLISAQPDSG